MKAKAQRGDVLYHWPSDRIALVEHVGRDWVILRTTMRKTVIVSGRVPSSNIRVIGILAARPTKKPRSGRGKR